MSTSKMCQLCIHTTKCVSFLCDIRLISVASKPHQVVGVHSELLQLSHSRQISSLQLLQSRTSKRQPPQPEQPLKHGPGAQAAGGEEGRAEACGCPNRVLLGLCAGTGLLYLYGLSSRLSCCRAPSLSNHLWLRAVSRLSDKSRSSRLHRESNADGWITASLLPGGVLLIIIFITMMLSLQLLPLSLWSSIHFWPTVILQSA